MLVFLSVVLALAFGLAASFLMSRASNFSAAANIGFGVLFLLALASVLFLIIVVTEHVAFPSP